MQRAYYDRIVARMISIGREWGWQSTKIYLAIWSYYDGAFEKGEL